MTFLVNTQPLIICVSVLRPPGNFLNLTFRRISLLGVESLLIDETRTIFANVRQVFNIIENHSWSTWNWMRICFNNNSSYSLYRENIESDGDEDCFARKLPSISSTKNK
jgi:hypothetical protein